MDHLTSASSGGAAQSRSGSSLPSLGRTLGSSYVCGGLVAVLWLRRPHGDGTGDAVVLTMALLAIALGTVLPAAPRAWSR